MLPLHARPPPLLTRTFGPTTQEAVTATAASTPACSGDTAVVFVVNPMPAKQTATSGFGSSSAPGALADAVAAVKTLAHNLPQPAPWRNLADVDGWHTPRTAEQARAKLSHNFSKFGVNYGYIVVVSALVSLCLAPLVALAVASAAATAAWIVYDTRHVGVTIMKSATRVQRQGAAAALCVAAVLFSGAASVACTGVLSVAAPALRTCFS